MSDSSPPASLARQPVPLSRVIAFVVIAAIGAAVDLWSKAAVFTWRGLPGQRDVYWLIDGYFGIETAVNTGAVFGMGAGKGTLFAALSVVAGIAILVWLFWFGAARSWWLTVALGCVAGGILGNLYDRLGLWWRPEPGYHPAWQSGVRDWILWQASDRWRWPNFNIADALLVTGAVMLLYHSFFPPDEFAPAAGEGEPAADPSREPAGDPGDPADDPGESPADSREASAKAPASPPVRPPENSRRAGNTSAPGKTSAP